MKTPQWTAGKNFDDTGAFGPWFVTPDEIPAGAEGLTLQTRLNRQVVTNASTSDMIYGGAETISPLSPFMTMEAGDVVVMCTPAGIGFDRKQSIYMHAGDDLACDMQRT